MRQPDSAEPVVIRRFIEDDSVEELTVLLHRAYADHAAAGLVFFASYQTPEDTLRRLGKGECWVALERGTIVGSVTVTGTYDTPPGYPAPVHAGSFWQLAVDPARRGTGLGHRLLTLAETRITALGASIDSDRYFRTGHRSHRLVRPARLHVDRDMEVGSHQLRQHRLGQGPSRLNEASRLFHASDPTASSVRSLLRRHCPKPPDSDGDPGEQDLHHPAHIPRG